jgi:hypothetical protein
MMACVCVYLCNLGIRLSQLQAPAASPPSGGGGEELHYPLNRRLGGPHGRSGRFEEAKNLLPLSGIEPVTVPVEPLCLLTLRRPLLQLCQGCNSCLRKFHFTYSNGVCFGLLCVWHRACLLIKSNWNVLARLGTGKVRVKSDIDDRLTWDFTWFILVPPWKWLIRDFARLTGPCFQS